MSSLLSGVRFVSKTELDKRKQAKAEAAEKRAALEEENERRREQKERRRKERGEDTWINPDLDRRLKRKDRDSSSDSEKAKKAKKKKKKKDKKQKKSKRSRRDQKTAVTGTPFSSSSEEEIEPLRSLSTEDTASGAAQTEAPLVREAWMTTPMPRLARPVEVSEEEKRKQEQDRKIQEEIDAGLREPGSGLLYGLSMSGRAAGSAGASQNSDAKPTKRVIVGDGGASWRAKALRRARERAAESGQSVDEVVSARFSSVRTLQEGSRGAYHGMAHLAARRRGPPPIRREDDDDPNAWRERPSELDDTLEKRRKKLEIGKDSSDKTVLSKFKARMAAALGPQEALGSSDRPWDEDGEEEGSRRSKNSREDRCSSERSERHSTRPYDRTSNRRDDRSRYDGARRGNRREQSLRGRRTDAEGTDEFGRRRPRGDGESRDDAWYNRLGDGSGRSISPSDRGRIDQERRNDAMEEEQEDQKVFELKKKMEEEKRAKDEELRIKSEEEAARRKTFLYGRRAKPVEEELLPPPTLEKEEIKSTPYNLEDKSGSPADIDLNKVGAQLMKAKLKNNSVEIERLSKLLEEAKARQSSRAETAQNNVVVISQLDERGRPMQLPKSAPLQREDLRWGSRRGKLKDNKEKPIDLRTLVEQERLRGAEDMDKIYAQNIVRLGGRYRGDELGGDSASGFDEEDQVDTKMFENRDNRLTASRALERQRDKAIADTERWNRIAAHCWWCMESQEFKKHLIISLGEKSYLTMPRKENMVSGQCVITSIAHCTSSVEVDEDTWAELLRFKQSLRKMCAAQQEGVIFLETCVALQRRPHFVIECFPVPQEVEMDAPIYFKQALLEADEEWSTHRKIIDTSVKGLRNSIPKGFAYFHVEWLGGGYAHVIEDESRFPRTFGEDVIAGMMEISPARYGRKSRRRTFDDEKKDVLSFIEKWNKFDWTRELDGGDYVK